MNKMLHTALAVALIATGFSIHNAPAQTTVTPDFGAAWVGYMNVYENASGSQGAFVFGTGWGLPDVKSVLAPTSLTLQPNYNTYLNAVNNTSTNGPTERAFWTDSTDGGITAGPNGNKWMAANTFVEANGSALGGGLLTFDYNVTGFTLTNTMSAAAFIKVLNASADYATVVNDTAAMLGTGSNSITSDLTAYSATNFIIQYGFVMEGLNQNPANEVANGSVVVEVVPEPSTYALLALGAAGLGAHLIRRRRR